MADVGGRCYTVATQGIPAIPSSGGRRRASPWQLRAMAEEDRTQDRVAPLRRLRGRCYQVVRCQ